MRQFLSILLGLGLIFLMTVVFSDSVTDDLSENLIRLHIVANSDNAYDQEVKLRIRDEILKQNIDITDENTAAQNLYKIEESANRVLSESGFKYGASAIYGHFKFPEKNYGSFTLPPGVYKSVRVTLGNGAGKNWWCILSPPVCLIEGTVKFDETALRDHLSDETLTVVSGDCKYRLKIVEITQNIIKKIKEP